jgi:hypothetical protein
VTTLTIEDPSILHAPPKWLVQSGCVSPRTSQRSQRRADISHPLGIHSNVPVSPTPLGTGANARADSDPARARTLSGTARPQSIPTSHANLAAGDSNGVSSAAFFFDGDAGLRPALNLADAFTPILSGGDGHCWAWVRRENRQVGLPAKAEGPHSPEQKHSNRPVEETISRASAPPTAGDTVTAYFAPIVIMEVHACPSGPVPPAATQRNSAGE